MQFRVPAIATIFVASVLLPVLTANARGGGGHGGGHGGGGHHGGEHHGGEHHGGKHHGGHSHHADHEHLNHELHHRASWQHMNEHDVAAAHNHFHNAVNHRPADANRDMHHWNEHHADRHDNYHHWADHTRHNWDHDHYHWFNHNWWNNHPYNHGWWNYRNGFANHSWRYWWGAPAWGGFAGWFGGGNWGEPIYYDYGTGGNVEYRDNNVYVNDQSVGTAEEFAQSAADLATVPEPTDEVSADADDSDWMPLGTFSLSANEHDSKPSKVLQLAINREGIISGTMFYPATDKALAVQGRVDKESQRVALRVANHPRMVIETGLYNLTQEETPVLVHFGPNQVERDLLVRLKAPQDDQPGDDADPNENDSDDDSTPAGQPADAAAL